MAEQPEFRFETAELSDWRLDIRNHVDEGLPQTTTPHDFVTSHFEATFSVDPGTYHSLMPEPLYTVEITHDLNPWHRKTDGLQQWLRRLRAGLWWTFRKRLLRRTLVENWKMTIPNCRISQLAEEVADGAATLRSISQPEQGH